MYGLVLALAQDTTLPVGRSRSESFAGGYYVYIGSALGGLQGRLKRHLRHDRRRRWHVDTLLDTAPVVQVWYLAAYERLECLWAARLGQAPGIAPTTFAFGATDCRCHSHLFYSQARPSVEAIGWPGAQTIG